MNQMSLLQREETLLQTRTIVQTVATSVGSRTSAVQQLEEVVSENLRASFSAMSLKTGLKMVVQARRHLLHHL